MDSADAKWQDRLASWKEIAAYVGCDERTCLRWEKKLGLPVHRIEGASKSRVFAYRNELDRWMRERITLTGGTVHPGRPSVFRSRPLRLLIPTAGLAALILAAVWIAAPRDSSPADFRIEGSALIVLNKKGSVLWSYDTGLSNLKEESYYRARFQVKTLSPDEEVRFPLLLMSDLNRDGRTEVVFALKTRNEFKEGRILCFSDRGKVLWDFPAGRELRFGDSLYARDYRIAGLDLHDFDGDGLPELFYIAHHKPDYPCQLGVLDAKGRLIGEYWNSGYFSDVVFLDIDGDGRDDVLAAGLDNEYGKGCLAVFAPDRIAGSSPQLNPAYTAREIGPGSELYYILFPRTDADLADYPVESILSVDILRSRRFNLNCQVSRIYFELTPDLEVVAAHNSHRFQQFHAEAVRAGRVRSRLDPAYFERLKRGVLYWDGTAWVGTRTPNLRNVPRRSPPKLNG
jgi:hypothetical protein